MQFRRMQCSGEKSTVHNNYRAECKKISPGIAMQHCHDRPSKSMIMMMKIVVIKRWKLKVRSTSPSLSPSESPSSPSPSSSSRWQLQCRDFGEGKNRPGRSHSHLRPVHSLLASYFLSKLIFTQTIFFHRFHWPPT